MPINIPPNLSTSQYEHLVLQALSEIAGPGANITSIPSILSTSDFRHLVLYALNYIAANGSGTSVAKNLEFLARNGTGATIPKGSIVYINGAVSGVPRITLAQANNDTNSARTIGFAKTDIPDGSNGYVITQGELDNVKTFGIGAGIQLYLSPTTPGAFTQTQPVAPQHLVYVGVVITASTGSNFDGRILVGIQNGYELDEIHDVLITTPLAGQVLARNNANTLWINKTPTPFTISAGTGSSNFGGGGGATNWFNAQGSGYSSTANGLTRVITILETCVLKKVSLGMQTAAASVTGSGGVLGIRNITTGVNYNLISGLATTANDSFINYTATALNIPFTAGDQYAWFYEGFSAVLTNVRTAVTGYFYL